MEEQQLQPKSVKKTYRIVATFELDVPDEQYVEKLDNLYQEFDEFQKYHNLKMYSGLEDLISKTPGFWYKLVKPLLNNKFYALYEYTSSNYIKMVENNINNLVDKYKLTVD